MNQQISPLSKTLRLATILGGMSCIIIALWAAPAASAEASSGDKLSIVQAVILGLVEGLTEYLPVSSTGHLLVTGDLLGLDNSKASKEALDTYTICIQIGAIFAVVILYWGRIQQMLAGLFGRSVEGRKVLLAVISAFIPTAIIGLALKDIVQDQLFGTWPTVLAWLVGGAAILALTKSGRLDRAGIELADITTRHALIIGLTQAIALWPGVSRSLVTIVAGALVGLSLRAAVEFSFLLGLITLSAATFLEASTGGAELIETFGLLTPLIGLAVAFVSAIAAVKWMVDWLQERGLDIFGYYRIGLGLVTMGALTGGFLGA